MVHQQLKSVVISWPRPMKRAVAIIFDVLINFFTCWLTLALLSNHYWDVFNATQLIFSIFSIAFSVPFFIAFGLYRAIFRFIGSIAFLSLIKAFVCYGLLIFIFFTLVGVDGIPRSAGVIQPALLFIFIGFSRLMMRAWLGIIDARPNAISKDKKPRVLIYGAGSSGRQLAASLAISKEVYLEGFIDDDVQLQNNLVNGILVYKASDLSGLVLKLKITDIYLAIPSISEDIKNRIIANLSTLGVRVRKLPSLSRLASSQVTVSDLYDLDMNELLGRDVVPPNLSLLASSVNNKRVVVTGAGGSIGSELCRQILMLSPKSLVLIDLSEHALYHIDSELRKFVSNSVNLPFQAKIDAGRSNLSNPLSTIEITSYLASVDNSELLLKIFKAELPDVVFHAAAYKHVPLVEANAAEGIRNNVFGTLNCAKVSLECHVSNFVLVSTDKAVRPTNIMGASKRIAELVIQALAKDVSNKSGETTFSMVRFGNVLGSSGSVAPLFASQIKSGGPLTLTHPDITRYFMTIAEAAQLVIQANALAKGGDLFVLDMGMPVRIYDLAVKMVYLSGLLVKSEANPDGDIEIKVVGLRPGEKLYEELLIGDNPQSTDHPKIMKAQEDFLSWVDLQQELHKLNFALGVGDYGSIKNMLKNLVPGYQPNSDTVEWAMTSHEFEI